MSESKSVTTMQYKKIKIEYLYDEVVKNRAANIYKKLSNKKSVISEDEVFELINYVKKAVDFNTNNGYLNINNLMDDALLNLQYAFKNKLLNIIKDVLTKLTIYGVKEAENNFLEADTNVLFINNYFFQPYIEQAIRLSDTNSKYLFEDVVRKANYLLEQDIFYYTVDYLQT